MNDQAMHIGLALRCLCARKLIVVSAHAGDIQQQRWLLSCSQYVVKSHFSVQLRKCHFGLLGVVLTWMLNKCKCCITENTVWHKSLQHTYSTALISRVWTPPIPSTVSSHPSLWNQMLVTPVEHLWTLCCASVALQRSTLWGNRCTTVNCRFEHSSVKVYGFRSAI